MNHTIKAISKFKETVSLFSQVEVKNRIATIYYNRCPVQFKTNASDGIYIKSSFMEGVYIPSKILADELPKLPTTTNPSAPFKIEPQNVQGLSDFLADKHSYTHRDITDHAIFHGGYTIALDGEKITRRKTNYNPSVSFALAKENLTLLEKLSREGILDAVLYDNHLTVATPGETIKAFIELPRGVSAADLSDGVKAVTDLYFAPFNADVPEIAITELLESVKSFLPPISAFKKEPSDEAIKGKLTPDVLTLFGNTIASISIKIKRTLSRELFPEIMYVNVNHLLAILNEFKGCVGKIKIKANATQRSIVLRTDDIETVTMSMLFASESDTHRVIQNYKELTSTAKPMGRGANGETIKSLKAEIESLRTALGAAKEQIKNLTETIESHPKIKKATLSQARYIARSKRMSFQEASKLSILEAHELINVLVAEKCNNIRDRLQTEADAEEEKEEAQS